MQPVSRVTTPAVRIAVRQASSHAQDVHAPWREINRLASQGKWDNVNNMPKMFLFGHAKKETYAAYNAINHKSDFWSQSPYGQFMKIAFRLGLLLTIIKTGVVVYEFVIPEQSRLKYKYRHHGGHEEAHH